MLAATSSLIGLLTTGGPGRQVVQTARGATVTLYGAGLYTADTWLIGAGNRGQDLAMLIFELPVLLLVLRWYSQNGPVAPAVLAGVLAFFTYYYVSLVFGVAQNRLFPLYVTAASLAGFGLVLVTSRLNVNEVAAALPAIPSRSPALLAAGLEESVDVQVAEVTDAPTEPGPDVALIVAGGPTHAFSMSRTNTRADAIS